MNWRNKLDWQQIPELTQNNFYTVAYEKVKEKLPNIDISLATFNEVADRYFDDFQFDDWTYDDLLGLIFAGPEAFFRDYVENIILYMQDDDEQFTT